jgi:hypothetical protein
VIEHRIFPPVLHVQQPWRNTPTSQQKGQCTQVMFGLALELVRHHHDCNRSDTYSPGKPNVSEEQVAFFLTVEKVVVRWHLSSHDLKDNAN